jgi:hypothetical protein
MSMSRETAQQVVECVVLTVVCIGIAYCILMYV